jgi:multiple sugar transport system substrate-binding protein
MTRHATHAPQRRRLAGAALIAAMALSLTACFGSSEGGSNDDPNADVTITFWHGWSAPSEVQAIQATIDAFENDHPNIHVKAVGNITDDKINQALRAGGSSAPDVVSSFTTDNVGEFCNSHAFVDLNPFMKDDGIDPEKTFPGP